MRTLAAVLVLVVAGCSSSEKKQEQPSQMKLFTAMDFVWRALHDPTVPEKDKKTAQEIQKLMKQLPKCCDDSIFDRAAPHK